MGKNWKEWEQFLSADNPWKFEMPEMGEVSAFQRLMLIKILREEETLYAMSYYVEAVLGKKFTSNNPESIEEIYNDTD